MSVTTINQDLERVQEAGRLLPSQVLPIYEFAIQTQPHAVLVCDRDARPIGAALEMIRAERSGLDSVADRWYYRRISKSMGMNQLVEYLRDPLVSLEQDTEPGNVMIVDDYISNSATTLRNFREACRRLRVTRHVDWVTLGGKSPQFSVFPYAGASVSMAWRDRPEVVGIDYDGTTLSEFSTPLSTAFYAAIKEGVRQLNTSATGAVNGRE